jgi:hypothetical protein
MLRLVVGLENTMVADFPSVPGVIFQLSTACCENAIGAVANRNNNTGITNFFNIPLIFSSCTFERFNFKF